MKKIKDKRYLIITAICLLIIIVSLSVYFLTSMSSSDKTVYIYIDKNDTADSVYAKLEPISNQFSLKAFATLSRHMNYEENIHTGRYKIGPNESTISVFKKLKSGIQEPVGLTIPSVRTTERLAGYLSEKLMLDSTDVVRAMTDSATCSKYGYKPETIICMFIPNTYNVYWDASVESLLNRMAKESEKFWNEDRTKKAEALGMSQTEVITLASIIDEETANNGEKPMIAGMYYNRIKKGMHLQACPTVKFALKNFSLKRIYDSMLTVDSPYNTYRYAGLPPGPIRIPSVAGIDAVLNMVKHDYLYICAKEDFSGTHNFARTYQEHMNNSAKYSKELNKKGIR